MKSKKDKWGNFHFPDVQGIGEELTVIPFQHYRYHHQWVVSVQTGVFSQHYFVVMALDYTEAAEKGVDAYVRYLVEKEEIKQILANKEEDISTEELSEAPVKPDDD